ncbi:oligosaccharide flippase family protein [Paenibacillus silviterrae]|uniref:oligosaccharide flippase family protein n=1 Tax=Paenibacillus silviterrae TaxID=3242194 RepID=UPI002543A62A|nr:oligosaccharide flippase family protein [Paenibacillus chinjuensis]
MKRLFLSGLAINLLVMVVNFATGLLSARYLGPEGRGVLAIAIRWSTLFSMLFTIGLPGAVIYLGKQFPEKQREVLGGYIVVGTAVGLLGLLLGELLLPVLLGNQPEHVTFLAKIAMIGVPLGVLADGFIGTLQTLNQFRRVMLLRVLNPLGSAAIIGILLLLGQYTVGAFIAVSLLWSAVIFALPVLWVFGSLRPRFSDVWENTKQLFAKGLQIYAGSLVSTFGGNLDQLVMSFFLTTYVLGLYSVSASIGTILPSVVIGAIGIYLFPKLMDMPKEARQRQVEKTHSLLLYGTGLLAVLGIALLPFVLPLFYGEEYRSAVLMGQILLAAAPFQVVYMVLINFTSTEGKFHIATLCELLGMSAGLGAMLLLLESLHGTGAAIGVLSAAMLKWSYITYRASRMGLSFSALLHPDKESMLDLLGKARARITRSRRKRFELGG